MILLFWYRVKWSKRKKKKKWKREGKQNRPRISLCNSRARINSVRRDYYFLHKVNIVLIEQCSTSTSKTKTTREKRNKNIKNSNIIQPSKIKLLSVSWFPCWNVNAYNSSTTTTTSSSSSRSIVAAVQPSQT